MPLSNKTFILSTDAVNYYGYKVLTAGIDVEKFKQNPVLLYMHKRGEVLGRWENIRIENGALVAQPFFDDADPEAMKIYNKVEAGILKAASVWIDPLYIIDGGSECAFVVATSNILEGSIVDVSGNNEALTLSAVKDDEPQPASTYSYIALVQKGEVVPQNMLLSLKPQKQNGIPIQNQDMKKIALLLGLDENATEAQIEAAIQKLAADAKSAAEKVIELTLSVGEAKGVINDKNKESFRKLANADPTNTLALIDTQTSVTAAPAVPAAPEPAKETPLSLSEALRLAVQNAATPDNKQESDADKYDRLDKTNQLAALRRDNPAEFNKLKAAKLSALNKH